MFRRSSNATNIERRNDNNKNNKVYCKCKQSGHFARNCKAPREVKSKPLAAGKSQNTRVSKRTLKEKNPKKVAWSEEDATHRQALVKCAKAYAEARQEVLSIPNTSVVGDIQYAVCLLNQQRRAETWPDQFEPKYDLSEEALVAGRIMMEFSDLTTKLHQELNYDFYWAVNETSKILSKVLGMPYDDDDLEDYDLGE
ncbi:uncharacterized protein OCT59_027574 [Rhizophagus irregularis]|uniref:CCHC-type domain-containing protein n=1 Tax=Rhizophagus irregularis (strain DAOM 181602 / DAOM 197198 / MUCL 43194) TaxID=747089 RepID=A0A2H5R7Y5_RHIID|nr:hypothetical protein GLOIN_2v260292 [Rhizophagus irregularis DAOM 181602=DAOM 197198]POG68001.1 hypothetical protein GLOIN_2v260292 [Rhizophagus irregularis DAOM 181602=DAOM 197198]UZO07287.1 hypothetical protein OCT59_027574 [Rhizophagus irregularis]GBC14191.1 hypothetical protein GLOIN_2v260292 [Rhizophagus irregularis DAOM 181602=DAOM 197198]|eukprot:XP_025174867.1 hypothetical protein GLOIN_2v260292 [Rhizophagus irregularis DAOM 181602=DAOM 197198]